MIGSMVSLILPLEPVNVGHHLATDPLQRILADEHRIEVPVLSFGGHRLLRISCQSHTSTQQIEALSGVLSGLLG
jgi:hypothetical protein